MTDFNEMKKEIEKLVDEKYMYMPQHLKRVQVNKLLIQKLLDQAGLKLSDLPHPKKCKKCGYWLRRHIFLTGQEPYYGYYCNKCGNEFTITLRKLIEWKLKERIKMEVSIKGTVLKTWEVDVNKIPEIIKEKVGVRTLRVVYGQTKEGNAFFIIELA